MSSRRTFLTAISALGPLHFLLPKQSHAAELYNKSPFEGRDYYGELGVKGFINCASAYSSLGGARMLPQVIEAMNYAMQNKVRMEELHDVVGERIAKLAQCESAMVTAGATSAISLGTAACMTLGDKKKIYQLPRRDGIKHEVIIQRKHAFVFDRAIRVPGAVLVFVESEMEVRNAINNNTAMMFFLIATKQGDNISMDRYIILAKELGIPTFCDAATTIPPFANFQNTVARGFDLVCFSGGKGLRGPSSAGILLGRRDLIKAARLNSFPNVDAIGRGMKVAAEEYLGMMVAVEQSMAIDEDKEFNLKMGKVKKMADIISALPSLRAIPHEAGPRKMRDPYLSIEWDDRVYKISKEDFKQALRDGDPSVEIHELGLSRGEIHLATSMLLEGEETIAAEQVKKVLLESA